MSLLFGLPVACALGLGSGFLYFGSLWLTVAQLPTCRAPALWMLASYALRTLLLLVVFYFMVQRGWEQLAACLVGFLIARTILLSRLRLHAAPRGSDGALGAKR